MPYITRIISCRCGPCQQEEWDKAWVQRLERARSFLSKVIAEKVTVPVGQTKVQELSNKLEFEYGVAAWDVRKLLPVDEKPHPGKTRMGEKVRGGSPLRKEIRPEDIGLGQSAEEREEEGDGLKVNAFGYPIYNIFSCDDMPSSGNQPYDAVPDSAECGYGSDFDATVDFNRGWGDQQQTRDKDSVEDDDTKLIAWGPEAQTGLSSSESIIGLDGQDIETKQQQEAVEMIVKTFWQIVGPEPSIQPSP